MARLDHLLFNLPDQGSSRDGSFQSGELDNKGRERWAGVYYLRLSGHELAFLEDVASAGTLSLVNNVGGAAGVFRDIVPANTVNLRSLRSTNGYLTVAVNGDNIDFTVNAPPLGLVSHTLFVDSTNGNNADAAAAAVPNSGGNIAVPFLTPNAALDWLSNPLNVAPASRHQWVIHVLPGYYNNPANSAGTPQNYTFQLANRGDVNIFMDAGAIVDAPPGGGRGCFGTFGTGILTGNLNIVGYGEVRSTVAGAQELFFIQGDNVTQQIINIRLASLVNSLGAVCFSLFSFGTPNHLMSIEVDYLSTTNTLIVNSANNEINLECAQFFYSGANRVLMTSALSTSISRINVFNSRWTNMRFLNTSLGRIEFSGPVFVTGPDPFTFSGVDVELAVDGTWVTNTAIFFNESATGSIRWHGNITFVNNDAQFFLGSPLNAAPSSCIFRDGTIEFQGSGVCQLIGGPFVANSFFELYGNTLAPSCVNGGNPFIEANNIRVNHEGSTSLGSVPRCIQARGGGSVTIKGNGQIQTATSPAVYVQTGSLVSITGDWTVTSGALGETEGTGELVWYTRESRGASGVGGLFVHNDFSIVRPAGRFVNLNNQVVFSINSVAAAWISDAPVTLVRTGAGAVSAINNARIARYFVQSTAITNATGTVVVGAPINQFQTSALVT